MIPNFNSTTHVTVFYHIFVFFCIKFPVIIKLVIRMQSINKYDCKELKRRRIRMESQKELEKHMYSLETALLKGEVRKSAVRLNELIADDFIEYSSTGKIYNKENILNRLPSEDNPRITMSNFQLRYLSPTAVLTTFKVYIESKQKYSLRSSVWKLNNGKWQMTFPQGTITGS